MHTVTISEKWGPEFEDIWRSGSNIWEGFEGMKGKGNVINIISKRNLKNEFPHIVMIVDMFIS